MKFLIFCFFILCCISLCTYGGYILYDDKATGTVVIVLGILLGLVGVVTLSFPELLRL